MNKFNSGILIRGENDPLYNEDTNVTKSIVPEGDGLVIAIGTRPDGTSYPLTDKPEDVIGAAALQAWKESDGSEPPLLWILRAIRDAGITEINGTSVAEMLEGQEAAIREEEAESSETPGVCQCAAAMYVAGFGMVARLLERWAKKAIKRGDHQHAMELALGFEVVKSVGEVFAKEYTGLPIESDMLHDYFHSLGLYCPDLDGEAEPSEERKRDTRHFEA